MALTLMVNNVDDHWRNHGFVRTAGGWRLSPVFDVNPSPQRGVLSSRLISDRTVPGDRDIRDLMDAADAFQLRATEASQILAAVAHAVDGWADVASDLGVSRGEIQAMAGAFDEGQRRSA